MRFLSVVASVLIVVGASCLLNSSVASQPTDVLEAVSNEKQFCEELWSLCDRYGIEVEAASHGGGLIFYGADLVRTKG